MDRGTHEGVEPIIDEVEEIRSSKFDKALIEEIGALVDKKDMTKILPTFLKMKEKVSDGVYWTMLSRIWVSFSAFGELSDWESLFRSNRPNRRKLLMIKKEHETFRSVAPKIKQVKVRKAEGSGIFMSIPSSKIPASRKGFHKPVKYDQAVS